MKFRVLIAACTIILALPCAAAAMTISAFDKTKTDDVFRLTSEQAARLGHASAEYIGFLELENSTPDYDDGDIFNATSLWNSVAFGGENILAFLNGDNEDLVYTGAFLQPLGDTTFTDDKDVKRAVAVLFRGLGDVAFVRDNGVDEFNADQADRDEYFLDGSLLGFPAPPPPPPATAVPPSAPPVAVVPLPASLPLLALALGGAWMIGRRRRA